MNIAAEEEARSRAKESQEQFSFKKNVKMQMIEIYIESCTRVIVMDYAEQKACVLRVLDKIYNDLSATVEEVSQSKKV